MKYDKSQTSIVFRN